MRSFLDNLDNAAVWLAAICLASMCLLVNVNIALRQWFGTGIPDEVVIVGELMAGVLVLPLASAAARGSFISVEIFTNWLSPNSRAILRRIGLALAFIAVIPVIIVAYMELEDTISTSSFHYGLLELPEWPGRIVFFAGYLLFAVRLLTLLIDRPADQTRDVTESPRGR